MPDKRDAEPLNPKKEWKQKLPDMHISIEYRACIFRYMPYMTLLIHSM